MLRLPFCVRGRVVELFDQLSVRLLREILFEKGLAGLLSGWFLGLLCDSLRLKRQRLISLVGLGGDRLEGLRVIRWRIGGGLLLCLELLGGAVAQKKSLLPLELLELFIELLVKRHGGLAEWVLLASLIFYHDIVEE